MPIPPSSSVASAGPVLRNPYIRLRLLLLALTAAMTLLDRSPVAQSVLIGVLVVAMLLKTGLIAAEPSKLTSPRVTVEAV